MDPQQAKSRSEAFHGCGSTLYIRTWNEWVRLLGTDRGAGVYGMLVGFREKVIPAGVSLNKTCKGKCKSTGKVCFL